MTLGDGDKGSYFLSQQKTLEMPRGASTDALVCHILFIYKMCLANTFMLAPLGISNNFAGSQK
jgi:hypothetical protein